MKIIYNKSLIAFAPYSIKTKLSTQELFAVLEREDIAKLKIALNQYRKYEVWVSCEKHLTQISYEKAEGFTKDWWDIIKIADILGKLDLIKKIVIQSKNSEINPLNLSEFTAIEDSVKNLQKLSLTKEILQSRQGPESETSDEESEENIDSEDNEIIDQKIMLFLKEKQFIELEKVINNAINHGDINSDYKLLEKTLNSIFESMEAIEEEYDIKSIINHNLLIEVYTKLGINEEAQKLSGGVSDNISLE